MKDLIKKFQILRVCCVDIVELRNDLVDLRRCLSLVIIIAYLIFYNLIRASDFSVELTIFWRFLFKILLRIFVSQL